MKVWLLAQAAVAASPQPVAPPVRIDLLQATNDRCAEAPSSGDIVVCGRPGSQRLERLPDAAAGPSDPMAFRLPGGGKGRVHAIQTTLPGATGQGAAMTLRMPVGKAKRD